MVPSSYKKKRLTASAAGQPLGRALLVLTLLELSPDARDRANEKDRANLPGAV